MTFSLFLILGLWLSHSPICTSVCSKSFITVTFPMCLLCNIMHLQVSCLSVCSLVSSNYSYFCFCSGSKIFSTFIGFLKSKDPNDGTEEALLNELTAFNDYLKENVSPVSCLSLEWSWLLAKVVFTCYFCFCFLFSKKSC